MAKSPKQTNLFDKHWRRFAYKNTLLLILSLILFFNIAKTPFVENLIAQAGMLGYLGAFITGIFFVSTFTVAPAVVVLFRLAEHLDRVEVALLAGLGAMVGDYVIFRFVKDKVFDEISPPLRRLQPRNLRRLFRKPAFSWLVPVAGAIIIASPLPDEIGVSMLGLSKISKVNFFIVVFTLNVIGIFAVVTIAKL